MPTDTLKEWAIIIAIFLTVFVLGFVWQERGKLDTSQSLSSAYEYAEPKKEKIDEIEDAPDDPAGDARQLLRGAF